MKLAISTTTANRQFVKALRRQQQPIDELKRRFEHVVAEDCPHEVLLLAFVDAAAGSCVIVPGDQDVFEVECGIDSQVDYPEDDDVLLIQLLERCLNRMIAECGGLGDTREEFLHIVENWTSETISR